jgi:hypothetical protein
VEARHPRAPGSKLTVCTSKPVTETSPDGSATASLCACRAYRYTLTRRWGPGSLLPWIMLNPSTADALANDPTIRRVMKFARRWGYGGIIVVNLFALRSSDPKVLRGHLDPVGLWNDEVIQNACFPASRWIAAWGAGGVLHDRDQEVCRALASWAGAARCLGLTANRSPKHPLARGKAFVPYGAALLPYIGR